MTQTPQIRVLDGDEAMQHWWPRFMDLWQRTWPPNPDAAFDPDFENTMFVALALLDEQGKLLGVCSWIDRTITVDGAPQPIAGLAGVAVEEEYRGRGYGKLLLENAIAEVKRRGYRWGVLFCSPHRQTFYEQFGWRVLQGKITQTRFRTECGVLDDDLVMALPLSEAAQAQWPQWEHARLHVGVGQW